MLCLKVIAVCFPITAHQRFVATGHTFEYFLECPPLLIHPLTAKDDPDRAAKIEQSKQDSVQKAKAGYAEWKPELASNSEQSVKAEKNDKSIKEMQEEGAKKAEQGKEPSSSG